MTPTLVTRDEFAAALLGRIITYPDTLPAIVSVVGTAADARLLSIVAWTWRLAGGRVLIADAEVDGIPLSDLTGTPGQAVSADGACVVAAWFLPLGQVHRIRTIGREALWRHGWGREFEIQDGALVEINAEQNVRRPFEDCVRRARSR